MITSFILVRYSLILNKVLQKKMGKIKIMEICSNDKKHNFNEKIRNIFV